MSAGTRHALRESYVVSEGALVQLRGWPAVGLMRMMSDRVLGLQFRGLAKSAKFPPEFLDDLELALAAASGAFLSELGSAEVAAEVVVTPSDPMTVTAAASLLEISPRQVRNLAARTLGGVQRRRGGPYVLDRRLVEIDARRRKVAS